MANIFDTLDANVPTPPARPVTANVFDTLDPPLPRVNPRNVFDEMDAPANASIPPGAPTDGATVEPPPSGFFPSIVRGAERQAAGPGMVSGADVVGLKFGTKDPAEFAREQAAMAREQAKLPLSSASGEFGTADYFGALIGQMGPQIIEGLGGMALGALGGGVVGAAGGPIGAAGGALTGAGAGAGLQDMGISFRERLRSKGVNVEDEAALLTALQDPETFEDAFWYAAKRAGTVGALTAATGLIGGKLAGSVAKPVVEGAARTVPQKAAVAATGAGAGVVGGAAQEAGAQLVSTGGIEDPQAILDEAIGGIIGEAPGIVAGAAVEGGRAVRDAVMPRAAPDERPRTLGAVFDPVTGQVRLTDNVFDLDMSDPEVVGAATIAEEAIAHIRALNMEHDSATGWFHAIGNDVLERSQIGKRLKQWLGVQEQTNPRQGITLDSILEQISAPLARKVPNAPNAPTPPSMVPTLKIRLPKFADIDVELAEGADLHNRPTLVVAPNAYGFGKEVSEVIVQHARDLGKTQLAFDPTDTNAQRIADFLGVKVKLRAVDQLFGGGKTQAVVELPSLPGLAEPIATTTGVAVTPSDPTATIDPSKVRQPLTQKMKPEEIADSFKQMVKAAQDLIQRLHISKKVEIIQETMRPGLQGEARWQTGQIAIDAANLYSIEDMWRIIMHEVGHFVMFDRLYRADVKTQLAILSDYATWRAGLANEVQLQRQHRQIRPSREATTQILEQFDARTRRTSPMWGGDPNYTAYWQSYTEWFAQQVARWATTQDKPLTVVDQFFASLSRALKRLLERLYRSTGLRFDPSRAVQTYLDTFLHDVTPTAFANIYHQMEQTARAQNQKALAAMGAPYVEAYEQTAYTQPSREVIRKLFSKPENAAWRRGEKKTVAELEGLAALGDKMSKLYEWGVGLYQLAEQNLHIRGLQLYKETISLAEIYKTKFLNPAIETAKRMGKIKDVEGFHNAADDYGQGRYRSAAEIAKGIKRLPTEEELTAIFDKHGLDEQARAVFRKMIADYAFVLDELEQIRRAEIEKKFRKPNKGDLEGARDFAAAARALQELEAEMAALRAVPYVPQMRFGDWAITVRDAKGHRVWFATAESERAQRSIAKEMAQLYPEPAFTVVTSVLAKDTIPMMGLPRPLLDMVAARVELSETQKEFLRDLAYEMAPAQSFRHRLQTRTNIEGYSKDFTRAYASYFLHAGNWMAKARYGEDLRNYVKMVQEQGRLIPDPGEGASPGNLRSRVGNYMANHMKEWLDPKPDFWKLKAASFFVALGFNPISAFVNLTGTLTGSYPVLAAAFGDAAAMKALARSGTSWSTYWRKANLDASQAKQRMALELYKEGVLDESLAVELAGVAEGRNLLARFPGWDQRFGQNAANRAGQGFAWFMEKSSLMFQLAEKANRRITADAAFDLAIQNPSAQFVKDAIAGHHLQFQRLINEGWNPVEAGAVVTARRAVQTSQGVYSRWARPRFMRGKAGTLFQFKAFQQNLLWMLWNNPHAATKSLLAFGLLGGMMAQPGMEDISDLLKVLAHRLFGWDFDLEREARRMITDWTDIDPDWIMHGTAAYGFGLPGLVSLAGETLGIEWMQNIPNVDLSGRVSVGNLSPVPLSLLDEQPDVNRAIAQGAEKASGAAFGLGFAVYKALTDLKNPDAWLRLVPAAFRNMPKAYEALQTGRLEGPSGAAMLTFDVRDTEQMLEVLAYGVGLPPERLTKEWAADREVNEVVQFWYLRRQALLKQLAEAVKTGDMDERKLVLEAIKYFNVTLPPPFKSQRITADQARASVRSREQRRVLQERNIPMRRPDRAVAPEIRRLYVDDPTVVDLRKVPAP